MADKTINVKVAIEAADASKSLGDINKSLKQLKAAQEDVDRSSPDFKKLTDAINKTEGRIGDLNDKFKTLTGSGVEKVNASLGLMGEGLKNLDFDKFKIGLQGTTMSFKALGAAVAATGIGLLISGISYLITNFDELKKSGGFVGKMFTAIGNAITFVTDLITKFSDKLGFTNSKLEKQGEALITNAEKAKEALEGQTDEYDRQIKVAEASGKSTVKLEIGKQEAIVKTNKALVEQTIAYVRSGGKLTEEQNKLLTEQINAIKNAKAEEVVITEKAEKKKNDEYKKSREEAKKHKEEEEKDREKAQQNREKEIKAYAEGLLAKQKADEAYHKSTLDALNKTLKSQIEEEAVKADQDFINTENKRAARKSNDELDYQDMLTNIQRERDEKLNNANLTEKERIEIIQNSRDQEKQLNAETAQAGLSIAQQSTSALQGLSDFVFTIKKTNLEKGSKAEEETAKKQFKINKALAITSAVISTIQGVLNALTAQSVIPEPFGTILKVVSAVAVGIAGAANIAKISAQQFNPSGGGGGGAAPSIPSSSSAGASGAAASTATPAFGPQTFGINSGASGVAAGAGGTTGGIATPPPQKVYVTQTDIADQNKKVEVIQERATIG